ncbi:hypothetical protein BDZ91DRAFT_783116 [Kalaharituber pfeilii]|nr:hypothetical protein BDZ91DRAFT_783116 [Kalaharituber pfeilii]
MVESAERTRSKLSNGGKCLYDLQYEKLTPLMDIAALLRTNGKNIWGSWVPEHESVGVRKLQAASSLQRQGATKLDSACLKAQRYFLHTVHTIHAGAGTQQRSPAGVEPWPPAALFSAPSTQKVICDTDDPGCPAKRTVTVLHNLSQHDSSGQFPGIAKFNRYRTPWNTGCLSGVPDRRIRGISRANAGGLLSIYCLSTVQRVQNCASTKSYICRLRAGEKKIRKEETARQYESVIFAQSAVSLASGIYSYTTAESAVREGIGLRECIGHGSGNGS